MDLICFNTSCIHTLWRKQSDSREPLLAEKEGRGAEILFFTPHKFTESSMEPPILVYLCGPTISYIFLPDTLGVV